MIRALVAVFVLSWMTISGQSRVHAGEPIGVKSRPVRIVASASILQAGTRCQIEVDEPPPNSYQTVVATYEGTIVESNDEEVRLDVREVRRVSDVPAASKLSFSNRLFRNVGIGRTAAKAENPQVVIATSKIRSVTVLVSPGQKTLPKLPSSD